MELTRTDAVFSRIAMKLHGEYFLEYIKNFGERIKTRGPTPCPRGWGARLPPWARPCLVGPLVGLRCPSSRMKLRRHEEEPWRNQSRAPAELFCQGNFPPGGGNHRHHQRSSHWTRVNLLSNPSSSLVSNLCIQTSDWYLWVASSVDYSL